MESYALTDGAFSLLNQAPNLEDQHYTRKGHLSLLERLCTIPEGDRIYI